MSDSNTRPTDYEPAAQPSDLAIQYDGKIDLLLRHLCKLLAKYSAESCYGLILRQISSVSADWIMMNHL